MKKASQGLNSIFAIAAEMVKGNGEDSFYYGAEDNRFILAALDGCGGSGSKKYENYSGKTGAYVASRAICGGIETWFCESYNENTLTEYIKNSLDVCKAYADKSGRIMGSLGKAFPTTIAIITGNISKSGITANCYWAGDSRCYVLDINGLHQLTSDDLDGQDAMSNLTNDGVITNVINASTTFEIHNKSISITHPCIFITATDGCFGYLNSPMEFEYIITESLVKSSNMLEWKANLNNHIREVTGDDYTLCIAICGFDSFEDIRKSFLKRCKYVYTEYINSQEDVNELWKKYKKEYSVYL